MKKLSLLLVIAMLASITACGGTSNDIEDTTTAASTEAEVTVDTSLRENTPDNLPELDFKGETVTIFYRANQYADVVGGEEETGDLVNDAVFNRNRKVEERLNITLEYIAYESDVTQFSNAVRSVVTAGDDAYDIIHHAQYEQAILAVEGMLVNLIDAPYIDYDQPWWATDYMDIIAIHPDYRYQLIGDFSTSRISSVSANFVNKRMLEDNFGSVDDFYQMILDGNWTFEVMRKYCTDVYKDLNSDGKAGYEDILGSAVSWSSQSEHSTFSAGAKYTERGADGYPQLIADQSRNVEIAEKLYQMVFETEGFYYDSDYKSQTGAQLNAFKNGTMLFYVQQLGAASNYLREMNDPYGIIPRPKLDENQETYLALVHDGVSSYSVPVTNQNLDMACAVMEAIAAEGYRTVIPAYYEVALKVKYAQDDVSVQLIDLIYNNSTTDFIYANNYVFSDAGNLGTISRKLIQNKSKDYMSTYAGIQSKLEAAFETVFSEFKAKQ
ncbi:MAG: hypothetical protein IJ493_07495 [Clostridia bacterium]|nr:hypothetical protein [Clostridia bacterium]